MPTPESSVQQAAERLTGAAKQVAGEVLGDEQLVKEGELHKEKVDLHTQASREAEKGEIAEQEVRLEQEAREAEAERDRLHAQVATEREQLQAEAEARRAAQAVQAEKEREEQAVQAREELVEDAAQAQVDRAEDEESAEQLLAAKLRTQAVRERAAAERIEEETA
jgi:uncharacterized protein YjbJ (UPF0337 family)